MTSNLMLLLKFGSVFKLSDFSVFSPVVRNVAEELVSVPASS